MTRLFFSTINTTKGEKLVQKRIEPPFLLSRIMTFVLATALVILCVLGFTIYKMFPLNRPQIFFVTTTIANNQDIKLIEMQPRDENTDRYKQEFVREYIRHRNEIFANANVMHKKWNSENGVVRTMSHDNVYADFVKTTLFNEVMSNTIPNIPVQCFITFNGAPLYLASKSTNTDSYQVKFRYSCADSTGRITPKDYTIKIKILTQDETYIKWADRIENPLGLKVVEYKVISGDDDPLNFRGLETTEPEEIK
jgi:type IV secretory pathway component VirB8